MNNTMKKATTLLVAGAVSVAALAGTAEYTTTKAGKETIKSLKDGTIKTLGEKTSKTTTKFNYRIKNLFQDDSKNTPEAPLDDGLDGGDKDTVVVELNGVEYKLSKADYDLYDKLIKQIENDYNFSDEDEEKIEAYILATLSSKDGKSNIYLRFSSNDAEKQRKLTNVYATLQQRKKDIKADRYGRNSEETEKTRADFDSFDDYMAYQKEQQAKSKQQMTNATEDADDVNLDDDLDMSKINFDEENAELDKRNAELDKMNAETEKMLADAKARLQKSYENENLAKEELLVQLRKFVAAGGNPATEFDWYEKIAKEYNISPEDLVD